MSIFGDNPLAGLDTGESGTAPAADAGVADPAVVVDSPAVDAPVGDVVGDVGDVASEPVYFNPDDYKDQLVKLKVGGEDVELPLSEALANAMRGQDYTRKTQELAEQKRRLHQADALASLLDSDPAGTIRRLAEAYDLDSAGLQPVQRDPEEQKLVEAQRNLAAQQAALQQQRVENEIRALMQEYGLGEGDVPSVMEYAIKHGTDLETAHRAMSFETQRQAQQDAAKQEAQRTAARQAQIVHNGAGTQRGSVTQAPEKVDSIRDAWRLAEQQLKLT